MCNVNINKKETCHLKSLSIFLFKIVKITTKISLGVIIIFCSVSQKYLPILKESIPTTRERNNNENSLSANRK